MNFNNEELEELERVMKQLQDKVKQKEEKQKKKQKKQKKEKPKIKLSNITLMQYYYLRQHYPFLKYLFWIKIFPYIIMIVGFLITFFLLAYYVNMTI